MPENLDLAKSTHFIDQKKQQINIFCEYECFLVLNM